MAEPQNEQIAARLDEVALLLEEQGASPYRVAAYRRAAARIRRLSRPVAEILQAEDLDGLLRIRGVGESIARAIRQLVVSGRLPMLERLRGEGDPEAVLASVPGIGPRLAERLHDELGIDSLEELEAAAHDGRLRDIAGIGEKRLAGIRDVLATRLARVRRVPPPAAAEAPPVSELLDVDREYRERAAAGDLRRISPRRFNPGREAWLPVLHTRRGPRDYTVLFSNSARAHRLGKTRDWVVVYYDGGERQYTIITATRPPLAGRRIVVGREAECEEYYRISPVRNRAVAGVEPAPREGGALAFSSFSPSSPASPVSTACWYPPGLLPE